MKRLIWLKITAIILATGLSLANCGGGTNEVSSDNFEFDIKTGTITGYIGKSSKSVMLPSTINGIKVTTIGKDAFRGKKLTGISNLTYISIIEEGAFADNQLTDISFGGNIITIGAGAFEKNRLATVTIPDSVKIIEEKAFKNNLITDLAIGSKVTDIGSEAFAENNLSGIIIPKSVNSVGKDAFSGNHITSIKIGPNKPYAENIIPFFAKAYDGNGKQEGTYTQVDGSTWELVEK